jgi:peptidyl-tRNA hydrolase, PTH1 family
MVPELISENIAGICSFTSTVKNVEPKNKRRKTNKMSKYLIAGLGNIGSEYEFTRHNIGFEVANALAKSLVKGEEVPDRLFTSDKLATVHHTKYKGHQILIIKPTTYMNLSGKAVNFWLSVEKIPLENLLVITDDLALPFGTLRLKKKGSDGGHNGLADIAHVLNTTDYNRLRFGVGSNFSKGKQVDYVLGKWDEEEQKILNERIDKAVEIVKSFIGIGVDRTMSEYNNK